MALSSRALFVAGTLFALGSLSAGLVHCAQQEAQQQAQPVSAWQRLAAPAQKHPQTQKPVAQSAAQLPTAASAPFSAQPVPADARCAVCGMYPARFPRWAAQLHLRDGGIRFFESPREFFVFLRELPRYGKGITADDLATGYVTDFANGGWLPVSTAWFVRGSRVIGPMRSDALPAFASREAAAAFIAQQGGEILSFAETEAVLAAESAPAGHAHHH